MLLRKIIPDEVQLGMFIHGFEGSWVDHPFWRSKFLLTRPADVEKVRASAVRAVIIDAEKGVDRPEPPAPASGLSAIRASMTVPALRIDRGPIARRAAQARALAAQAPPRPARAAVRSVAATPGPCSAAEEFGRAGKVVDRASRAVIATFGEARLGKAVEGRKLVPLVDQIAASVERNSAALMGLTRLKLGHEYTFMHSVAVCTMMINLARHMKLDEHRVREAGTAGLLHDIGKMAVPADLLDKPGKLTDEEFGLIKTHPDRGHALLAASTGLPPAAGDVCLHHHERFDGQGYPGGIGGEAISLFARMAAICDVYDAVTSDRAYKRAWSPMEGLNRMAEWRGHFDEDILALFTQSIGIYPVGGLVLLHSRRLAVVTGETPGDPQHPPVRAFYHADEAKLLPPVAVATRGDAIVSLERPDDWPLTGWKARRQRLLAESIG